MIVNQSFVRRFFPDEDPLGKRVSGVRIPEMQNMPIVGVVGDTRRGGMLKGFTPEIYVSYAQFPAVGRDARRARRVAAIRCVCRTR